MSEIYEPAEDSYLMSEALKRELPKLLNKNPELKFLEVGCGSGINLETAKSLGVKNILGTDININAVKHCKTLGFNCVKSDLYATKNSKLNAKANNVNNIKIFKSDLFSSFLKTEKFDYMLFNPPYLPLDEEEPKDSRTATTGGKKGTELIIKFLKQAKEHLNKNGKILLITSSLSKDIDFIAFGYNAEVINEKKLFFEKLTVWKLKI